MNLKTFAALWSSFGYLCSYVLGYFGWFCIRVHVRFEFLGVCAAINDYFIVD